ncbi:conserved hypothetical protein [Uncinocarpus reesii 1704]|uniref:alpha-1,2-Mannosidase n=1 Tax=Uncinocarpus reesii (strain UAMH 1704) TaxID=336963 RepID=C4JKE4_UNCRE|nr:uncharacterized protein UREG_02101 [Uncinocarpus reesii 1704]EEP77252.1 conserved hypothetical protein [Uncinocarpus reesii 1704]
MSRDAFPDKVVHRNGNAVKIRIRASTNQSKGQVATSLVRFTGYGWDQVGTICSMASGVRSTPKQLDRPSMLHELFTIPSSLPVMHSRCRRIQMFNPIVIIVWTVRALLLLSWLLGVQGIRESRLQELRAETEHMFYHGFENYMKYAFPEDELRPLTCGSLTRDRENPAHIELNDVLGNYSLTLVDSLSTLAILSDAGSKTRNGWKAWTSFQDGVRDLVDLYGDGSNGPKGRGSRGRGFEVDSKVQVFETVIRGVGGLLSAHLFAVGDLPIRGYNPPVNEASYAKLWDKTHTTPSHPGIRWANGFVYDGQLLRLATDLATRLLPAFYTPTGLPYPRVNLRYGVPFYPNSPVNGNSTRDTSHSESAFPQEITETCSAGAGSLVLEFTVLSRLTGNGRFEELAKRAFWSVWVRRSDIGLIGAGIDAESGKWVNSYTGIGAGIDSFFEYALKSHILLSEGQPPPFNTSGPFHELDNHYTPLPEEAHSPDAFLRTWQQARNSIQHHLYRGSSYQHPHYIQGDIITGATRAFWMDSLSAYFPGLLTLAGDLDKAAEAHLLTAALWTRYSALPERWSVATGEIEGGLTWWGGRPEFVESTYYLYQATEDPWYLYVGEMAMRDIKRRCWTKCGWAGLQDVRTGQLSDRMESFFLGETANAPMATRPTLDLSFPPMPNSVLSSASLERVNDGIFVKSISGLRLGMIQDVPLFMEGGSAAVDGYRIQVINNIPLGKDEKVYVSRETTKVLEPTDPNFTQIEDLTMLDIIVDFKQPRISRNGSSTATRPPVNTGKLAEDVRAPVEDSSNMKLAFSSFMSQVTSLLRDEVMSSSPGSAIFGQSISRASIPALTATGKGAVPLPDTEEATIPTPWATSTSNKKSAHSLPWSSIYLAGELCDAPLPSSVPKMHQVIVIKRGNCSFSQKLRNIPGFRPSRSSLQLVIVVSYPQHGDPDFSPDAKSKSAAKETVSPFSEPIIELDESWLIRPLLDEIQVVADSIPRPHPISMVMALELESDCDAATYHISESHTGLSKSQTAPDSPLVNPSSHDGFLAQTILGPLWAFLLEFGFIGTAPMILPCSRTGMAARATWRISF